MPAFGSRMPDMPGVIRGTGRLRKNARADSDRAVALVAECRQELMEAIELCVASGVGFLISATRDGGALSVTVYSADKRERDYAGNPDDFRELLTAVRDLAEAALYQGTKEGTKVRQGPTS